MKAAQHPQRNAADGFVVGFVERQWRLLRLWWRKDVAHGIDQAAVIRKIAEDSLLTPRYIFMTSMSAGIAILGLLLASPAVVIGAMLLSPLMGPILGMGFALAVGKVSWLRLCARALLVGSVVAIAFCALIVICSPLQTVTSEIAARTRPNLFDLLVALFSSLAGSYAMIRGREGTIVGVAIATALMPPLATIGFGLATLNWTVFGGALMLFVTNFLTIALTATVMARLYGLRPPRGRQTGRLQGVGIVLVFLILAVPLGFSLRQIAWEANAQRIVNNTLKAQFDGRSRVSEQTIEWNSVPLAVNATVLTPVFVKDADVQIGAALEQALGRAVSVSVNQLQVAAEAGAAEEAEIARAGAAENDAMRREAGLVRERLALIAGIDASDVVIDRDARRAEAAARRLPGLDLAGYRELETRVATGLDDWRIGLRPPMLDLPEITLEDGEPDAAGVEAANIVEWAAARMRLPIVLAGPAEATEALAERLRAAGVEASVAGGGGNRITAEWEAAAAL